MKYRMIERCREAFPVRMMCQRLGVSPSGYYEWRTRLPSARAQANERLLVRIQALHAASDGVLGRRRICDDLGDEGMVVGVNRVGRLMKRCGIRGIPQRKRWRRKSSNPRPDHVTNHLERKFTASEPNTRWVTDITYSAPNLRRCH